MENQEKIQITEAPYRCRTCLSKNSELKSIFESSVDEMIMACASVQVHINDGLPQLICVGCINQINSAYSFKKLCEESDTALRQTMFKIEVEDQPVWYNDNDNTGDSGVVNTNEIKKENESIQDSEEDEKKCEIKEWSINVEATSHCSSCGQELADVDEEMQIKEFHKLRKQVGCICNMEHVDNKVLENHLRAQRNRMSGKRRVTTPSESMKKARRSITLEDKMEVIRRMEAGEGRPSVCKAMNMAPSTITTIIKNANKIKQSMQRATSVSASYVSYSRSKILEKMEQLLTLWVDDFNQKNIPLAQSIITEKAKSIFEELKKKEGPQCNETFLASKGWFSRFKARTKCRSVKLTGETSRADAEAADAFAAQFQAIVEEGQYPPDLIFNVDQTGLYWKKLPSRTFIARKEKSAPGFKAGKDRLTLLLGANVSGNLKLKPMLVYHSETPRAMRGLNKTLLPVHWKSNKKVWVTQEIFLDWYTNYFCPTVLQFCNDKNLPTKAILLLDNAPGHPPNLGEIRTPLEVNVIYMPPNITAVLQPMNQGVISTFKAYYLRHIFKQMVKALNIFDINIKEYWRSFNILKGVGYINRAWQEVTVSCLNGVWCKLLPDFMHNYGGFEPQQNVIQDITRLAHEVGMVQVSAKDVTELLESHAETLSNEDLEELAAELSQQQKKEEEEDPLLIKVMYTENPQLDASVESLNNELWEIDHDFEGSATIKMSDISSLGPRFEIVNESGKKYRQSTLGSLFKKRQPSQPGKLTDDAQPGPSIENPQQGFSESN